MLNDLVYILSHFVLTLSLCSNTNIVISGTINDDPISIYEGNAEWNGNLEADFKYFGSAIGGNTEDPLGFSDTVKHIAADCRVSPGNFHCE